jgi:hypothetical protein
MMCLRAKEMLMMLIGFRMHHFSNIAPNQATTEAIKYLYDVNAIKSGKSLER